MAIPNATDVKEKMNKVAEQYKSDLAWLAGFHEIVKLYQKRAEAFAKDTKACAELRNLLPLPQAVLSLPLPEHFPAGLIRERFERTFCRSAKPFSSDNFGHYLNKVAVVYAAAILEAFLEEAYEARTGGASIKPSPDRSGSVTAYVKLISDPSKKPCQPAPSPWEHVYVDDFNTCADKVLELDNLRHKVVHEHGAAQMDLAVDTVIMPHLEDAILFIDKATQRLLDNADPKNP